MICIQNSETAIGSPDPTARLAKSSILPISPADLISFSGSIKNISFMVGANKHDGNMRAASSVFY